jgi:hypothetical protein
MYRPASMKVAIGLGMLTILMLALTACGGSSAQEERANKVHTIPEDSQTYEGEPLPAGRYLTEDFKPAMSLTLSKVWTRGDTELRDAWDLRDIENLDFWLGFYSTEEVYVSNGSGGLKAVPAPEDMVSWLQDSPYLKTDKPKPTSVGGEEGMRIDVIVSGAPKVPECPGCVDLALFRQGNGETTGVEKGEKVRFIVLEDVKGQQVTILVETSPRSFKEFLAKSQKVIETVEWKGTRDQQAARRAY